MARVEAFDEDDTRIVPKCPVELAVAHVERDHARRAALKQDVGEASRRGPDVERFAPVDLNAERVERVGELDASTPDVRMVRRRQHHVRVSSDSRAGFCDRLTVDENLACENQRASALPRGCQTRVDEELVETFARHEVATNSVSRESTAQSR